MVRTIATTYDTNNLGLLIERVGADRLVMGTDYPFPLREVPPGAVIDAIDTIRAEEREAMLGQNALRFLFQYPQAGRERTVPLSLPEGKYIYQTFTGQAKRH